MTADPVIFPTQLAIGSDATDVGRGQVMTESDLESLIKGICGGRNLVISGFSVQMSGLTADIQPGEAIISGKWVKSSSVLSIVLPNTQNSRVLVQLVRDGQGRATGLVAGAQAHGQGTSALPADSLACGLIDVQGGAVVREEDIREIGSFPVSGAYTGTGVAQTIAVGAAGAIPKLVIVSGTESEIIGVGGAIHWGERANTDLSDVTYGFYFTPNANTAVVDKNIVVSQAWSPGAIAAGNKATTTVTANGAVVGDPVYAWHSGLDSDAVAKRHFDLAARVTSVDTVTVEIGNHDTGAQTPAGGDIHLLIPKTVTLTFDFGTESGLNQSFRPRPVTGGFRVAGALNTNNAEYSYVAIL